MGTGEKDQIRVCPGTALQPLEKSEQHWVSDAVMHCDAFPLEGAIEHALAAPSMTSASQCVTASPCLAVVAMVAAESPRRREVSYARPSRTAKPNENADWMA
jgi:hypothetical protein